MFWQLYMLYMWEEELYCSFIIKHLNITFMFCNRVWSVSWGWWEIPLLPAGTVRRMKMTQTLWVTTYHIHTGWLTTLNSLDIWHKLVRKVFTEVKLQCCFHIEFYISRLVTSQKNASLNIVLTLACKLIWHHALKVTHGAKCHKYQYNIIWS